jgi:hypothetical protein
MVDVNPAYVIQFSERTHMEVSQRESRLSPFTEVIPVVGKQHAYDGIGTVEASEVTAQYQPVEFDNIEHLRRELVGKQFKVVLPVDEKDVNQVLSDPTGKYAIRAAEAMKRRKDKVISDAAFADVKTGENMDTTVTFAADGGLTVDATAGLTKEKLDEVNRNYIDNEVSIEEDQMTMLAITGNENLQLMNEQEFLSVEFIDNKPLAGTGKISSVNGQKIVLFGANSSLPILDVNSTVRDCLSMAKGGIALGLWKDVEVEVQPRYDLISTWQIVVTMYIGAVRTEGVLVQKVQTTIAS